jgi:hypothetical protein
VLAIARNRGSTPTSSTTSVQAAGAELRLLPITRLEACSDAVFVGYPAGDPWAALPSLDAADGTATERNSISLSPRSIIRSRTPQRAARSGSPTRSVVVSCPTLTSHSSNSALTTEPARPSKVISYTCDRSNDAPRSLLFRRP